MVLKEGQLFLPHVNKQDAQWKYRCEVEYILSGEIKTPDSWSTLILSG